MLVAWLCIDVGVRLLPLRWFRIPPLLEAIRLPGPNSPFGRNLRLRTDQHIGEAALAGNRPVTERRSPLEFTTDDLGFRRNPYLTPGERPDVLFLLGASFTYGAGLSDDETLPAAFTRLSGLTAYNAGRFHTDDRTDLRKLDWLLARLPGRPSVAVLVHLDYENPRPPASGRSRLVTAAAQLHPALVAPAEWASRLRRRAGHARTVTGRWWRVSPFDVASTRLFKSLGNNRLLPNGYKDVVEVLHLPDGRPLLFRDYELGVGRSARSDDAVRATADYFAWWRDSLARRGIETHVLLLPTRYTVYGPWLEDGAERAAAARSAAELHAVESALAARRIRTTNALPVLRAGVEEEIRSGELSFYREDNHWNALGVARVARAIAAAVD